MTAVLRYCLLLLLCVLALTAPARAQAELSASTSGGVDKADDQLAHALFEAACDAYDQGKYEHSLHLFEQAHAYSKRPAFLFNIGHVADRLRQDRKALDSFRAYLAATRDAKNRAAVESRIAAIEANLARAAAEEQARLAALAQKRSVPTSEQVARAVVLATPPDRPVQTEVTPLRKKWWLWTAVGAVALGVGVGMFFALRPKHTRTDEVYASQSGIAPYTGP